MGSDPTGIAANRRKNEIYVVNTESNSISVIDAERNEVVATIGVHAAPYFIDVSADGKRAYVANSKSANVSVLDLDRRHVWMIPGETALTRIRGTRTRWPVTWWPTRARPS